MKKLFLILAIILFSVCTYAVSVDTTGTMTGNLIAPSVRSNIFLGNYLKDDSGVMIMQMTTTAMKTNGDLEFTDPTKGIIMTSQDGSKRFRIIINEADGTIGFTEIL
jgi:hypothetical protein